MVEQPGLINSGFVEIELHDVIQKQSNKEKRYSCR